MENITLNAKQISRSGKVIRTIDITCINNNEKLQLDLKSDSAFYSLIVANPESDIKSQIKELVSTMEPMSLDLTRDDDFNNYELQLVLGDEVKLHFCSKGDYIRITESDKEAVYWDYQEFEDPTVLNAVVGALLVHHYTPGQSILDVIGK